MGGKYHMVPDNYFLVLLFIFLFCLFTLVYPVAWARSLSHIFPGCVGDRQGLIRQTFIVSARRTDRAHLISSIWMFVIAGVVFLWEFWNVWPFYRTPDCLPPFVCRLSGHPGFWLL